jgi:hypothetical protein
MNPQHMTTADLIPYLRKEHCKDPATAVSKWLTSRQVPRLDRGRLLVRKADVDEALADAAKAWRKQHRTRRSA